MMSAEEYPSLENELAAIDFSDLEAKYAVKVDEDFSNILIIDGLPVVDAAKEEKLVAVLKKKFFGPANAELAPSGVFIPKGTDGMSRGYGFFEFVSLVNADAAYSAVHGVRLDKSHQLYAIRFGDFDRLVNMDEEYVEPTIEEYREKEYLKDWLRDPLARDQFATLSAGNAVQVCWGPRNGPAELVQERKPWTDAYIQWSSNGSFLATVHGPGVMLWGGKSWSRFGRFDHSDVKFICFSPEETYLVTMSLHNPLKPSEPNVLIWEVSSGIIVKGLVVESLPEDQSLSWPIIRFSSDDKYAAWAHNGQLSIYECENGFKLVDGKAIDVPGVCELSWSPAESKLAYWVPETENTPARVAMIQVPSKQILRTKNLFNVEKCSFAWQSEGDYLAVQVTRYTGKTKKSFSTNLEIFRLREKNIPVEVLDFKDTLQAVRWEPKGDRLLTAAPAEFRSIVTLWSMKGPDGTVQQLHQVERKQVERFFWSPAGNYLIMAVLGSAAAFLEFWGTNDMTLLATKEHFLATDVQWDPSGRYVTSFVSAWKQSSDNGYCIWDFKGDLITKQNMPRFATFLWRPRPSTLLSAEKQKEIKKNYKTYSTVFEAADLRASNMESSDSAAIRLNTVLAWNEFRCRCIERVRTNDARRIALLGQIENSEAEAVAEEWIEEVIEEIEEAISAQ